MKRMVMMILLIIMLTCFYLHQNAHALITQSFLVIPEDTRLQVSETTDETFSNTVNHFDTLSQVLFHYQSNHQADNYDNEKAPEIMYQSDSRYY